MESKVGAVSQPVGLPQPHTWRTEDSYECFSLMTRERMQMHAKYYLLYNNKDMLLFLSQLFSAKKLPLMEV